MRRSLHYGVAGLLVLAGLVAAASDVSTQAKPGTELTLPLRLSAFAVNMSGVRAGRSTNVWDIRINRWTTPDERKNLLQTIVEDKPNDILKALTRLPDHGRMRIPGHVGPDPMKVVLGWTLHYAWTTPLDEGGHRIVLATDRYITFEEARANPRTMDYPFTLLEIRLDRNGEGVGKAAVATKITFDKKKNTMELENYGIEPIRLQSVKIEK
jgi:hypothetical protein